MQSSYPNAHDWYEIELARNQFKLKKAKEKLIWEMMKMNNVAIAVARKCKAVVLLDAEGIALAN